jgi:UDP-glucose 4-epimerase
LDNYLVIGGTGVIGHFVTRKLVERGHRPVVLTVSGNTNFIKDVMDRIELVKGDITDADGLDHIVREYHITKIAHLGAVLDTEANEDPRKGVRVGVEGMVNVLEAARLNKVKRVVYTSTKGVYGPITGEFWHPTYKPVHEEYNGQPFSIYGIVKLSGELLGQNYQRRYGLEFIGIRFGTTVGPGKLRRHGLYTQHSTIIENAMLGRPTFLPRGADAFHDPVFNSECAEGVVAALMAPKPNYSIYNIGSGYGITLKEFADAVTVVYPEANIEIGPGPAYSPPEIPPGNCVLDITRARQDLGFEPTFTPVNLVQAYVSTMKELGLTPTPT